jgi:hypothetical protein
MLDILLTKDGDIHIDEWGDISLTESIRQAVRIRLLWFFNEWRFAPPFGVPYWEEVLVKNPNVERIRRRIRDEVLTADGVLEVRNIRVDINPQTRVAQITFDIVTDTETYHEEVEISFAKEEVSISWPNTD